MLHAHVHFAWGTKPHNLCKPSVSGSRRHGHLYHRHRSIPVQSNYIWNANISQPPPFRPNVRCNSIYPHLSRISIFRQWKEKDHTQTMVGPRLWGRKYLVVSGTLKSDQWGRLNICNSNYARLGWRCSSSKSALVIRDARTERRFRWGTGLLELGMWVVNLLSKRRRKWKLEAGKTAA